MWVLRVHGEESTGRVEKRFATRHFLTEQNNSRQRAMRHCEQRFPLFHSHPVIVATPQLQLSGLRVNPPPERHAMVESAGF